MSAVVDLPDDDWVLRTLDGAWARETEVHDRPLTPGRVSVGSTRGISSAEHNPVLILRRADHRRGPRRGARAEPRLLGQLAGRGRGRPVRDDAGPPRDRPDDLRLGPRAGRHVHDPGGRHRLVRRRPRRPVRRVPRAVPDAPRPWRRGAIASARSCSTTGRRPTSTSTRTGWSPSPRRPGTSGVELFVLDDGWYGHRDADDSSLGDWVVDRRKLPDGLDGVARRITDLGLTFGLWIEPEMVSPDSDLFRAHPDWAIGIPGRDRTLSRRQLVLDLGALGGRRPPDRRP